MVYTFPTNAVRGAREHFPSKLDNPPQYLGLKHTGLSHHVQYLGRGQYTRLTRRLGTSPVGL